MTTTATAAPSLIAALHARYEANDVEYIRIDAATPTDQPHRSALTASSFEGDAIRLAILTQVPDTQTEAAILLFHSRVAHENTSMATERDHDSAEAKALSMAIDTLFDFMASESPDLDHGAIGAEFQRACNNTHFARRHRTGDMI